MKNRGIFIVVLGIGFVDVIELDKYVFLINDIFFVVDFGQLDEVVIDIVECFCFSKLC